jgi:Arc/MetJ family transcription regulator
VYAWCMTRTNVDIDEKSCEVVMRRYNLSTKKEAVNMALRLLAREAMSIDEARKLRGTGWDEDLESLRSNRFS